MSDARKSGMRGSEREEAKPNPADRGTNPHGGVSQHIHTDESGDHHFNLSKAVAELEQHAEKPGDFTKENADKFSKGSSVDTERDAKGNENG